MRWTYLFGLISLTTVLGCGSSESNDAKSEPSKPAAQTAPTAQTKPAKKPVDVPPPEDVTVTEKAEVGVGAKGRGYAQGIVSTPIAAYFSVQERVVFNIELPDAVRAYQFEHDFKMPKTHEEYWRDIIQKYGLEKKLPQLKPGHRYRYEPKTQELMVDHEE